MIWVTIWYNNQFIPPRDYSLIEIQDKKTIDSISFVLQFMYFFGLYERYFQINNLNEKITKYLTLIR